MSATSPSAAPPPAVVNCPKCGTRYSAAGLPDTAEVVLFLAAVRTAFCGTCKEGSLQENAGTGRHLQLVTMAASGT